MSFNKIILSLIVMMSCSAEAASWTYRGTTGPQNWGSMPGFELCKNGKTQSPIAINTSTPVQNDHLSLQYKMAVFEIKKNYSNTYQYSLKPHENSVTYNGQDYHLVEIHFHVPSEHQLNHQNFPMEVHLVHANNQGAYLVIGVMLKVGKANNYLADLFNSFSFKNGQTGLVKLNPTDLVSQVKTYYTYAGSLTTPPCKEGITWILARTPAELSSEQLATFKANITPFNARPLQDLQGRVVDCEGC